MRLFLFSCLVALAGCAQVPTAVTDLGPAANVAGEWTWTCCGDGYAGTMALDQAGRRVTGTFDGGDGSGGELSGTVEGSTLRMTRTTPTTRQDYTLRVSADGQRLEGSFVGDHNRSFTTAFEARRVGV